MPKRPCAVTLTPDDKTILCADKFGDVYSLPLVDQAYEVSVTRSGADDGGADHINQQAQKPFVLSASSSTVHTKKNREALRQQQRLSQSKTDNKALKFDHQLVLGHVSLLTDIACVSLNSSQRLRNYVLTSDRDEHIRVSRGMPQAHIIEGFCLAHSEFVSKLCILRKHPRLLISGGGDDYLLLWDWLSGRVQQKIDLKGPVDVFRKQFDPKLNPANFITQNQQSGVVEEQFASSIAVSNIKCIATTPHTSSQEGTELIVTCEGQVIIQRFHVYYTNASQDPCSFHIHHDRHQRHHIQQDYRVRR